jgi:ATP-dependent Clp endopeptidase proteolytic subunit ClpP
MIGEDFWSGEGVTAKNFQKEISAIKASQIDLHINSPGGSVFDGLTIYNLLKQHPANITSFIDGLAASIASVIALAGDKVVMAENALYMMHNPFGMVMGNAGDMRAMADVLDKIRGSMSGIYMSKSRKNEEEINSLLDAETWLNADEALSMGFIDQIGQEMDLAACLDFVPAMSRVGFKKIPDKIRAMKKEFTERDIEKVLRDAGLSRSLAKEILAKGFSVPKLREAVGKKGEVQRDAENLKPVDAVSKLLIEAERMAPTTV